MKITRKYAHEIIAPFMKEACDSSVLDDIIFLAETDAYNSGRWWGMMKRIFVRVIEGRIVLPPEYSALEAINTNGIPRMIHSEWYEFSPNGPGSDFECQYHAGIFDLTEVPTVWVIHEGEQVVAVSKSRNLEPDDAEVIIQGTNSDGQTVYRYYCEDNCATAEKKSDLGEKITLSVFQGNGQYSPAAMTYNKFAYNGISDIHKTVTRGPVEIYAVGPRYVRKLVDLGPSQRSSFLRAYRVPSSCICGPYVECLVKKAEPVKLTQDHEVLQIENPTALVDLALAVYYLRYTIDPEKGNFYFTKGLNSLNGQLSEKSGGIQRHMKMWPGGYQRNKRYNPIGY